MTAILLSIVLSIIFLLLSLIHLNWAMGNKWGFKEAIPTKENGDRVFNPKNFDSIIVGLILLILACFYLLQVNAIGYKPPKWSHFFLWIIPSLFLLRAIGDFKYVGFFKNIKTTLFAKWDSKLFSPLCLSISIIGFLIVFLN